MNIRQPLKGTYYENSTFLGIWGVIVGIWCIWHTHANFEKSLYMIFWVSYAFLEAARLKLPNERVSFSARSYVGRGAHLNMTSHFPTPPFNQSISKTRPCVSWLEFIMSRIHKRCSVVGCMDVHKSLHRVPEDERATWIDFILEGEVPATVGKNLLVCAITTLRLFLQLRSVHGRISCETLSLWGVPSNFAWNTCRRGTCKYTNN